VTLPALLLLVAGVLLGVGVPWLGMRMLTPSLRLSEKAQATNYRGRSVFYGLGVVWLIWAGCAIIGGVLAASLVSASVLPILTLAGPLALVAFALGAVDDAYGSGSDRGFKGHLKAMARGRLTTGGMKLVGIGLASLLVAGVLSGMAPWAGGETGGATVVRVLATLVAGAAIALTSNLFNLLDLRPGRALKSYALLSPLALASTAIGLSIAAGWSAARGVEGAALDAVVLGLFLIGPFVAVYRYDLGEEGMLGDAGANPMGAVVGLLIVSGLPLVPLLVWTALVVVLNLASERVSFSAVIEGTTALRWLDGLGRLADLPKGTELEDGVDASDREERHTHENS